MPCRALARQATPNEEAPGLLGLGSRPRRQRKGAVTVKYRLGPVTHPTILGQRLLPRDSKGEYAARQARSARYFVQRAAAALRAISDRRSGLSFSARSLPPLAPPSLPRATRSGSLAGGSDSGHRSRIASM